jgi:hypothetical protein
MKILGLLKFFDREILCIVFFSIEFVQYSKGIIKNCDLDLYNGQFTKTQILSFRLDTLSLRVSKRIHAYFIAKTSDSDLADSFAVGLKYYENVVTSKTGVNSSKFLRTCYFILFFGKFDQKIS